MESKVDSLLKRYSKAKESRDCLASTWREISDYGKPQRQDIGLDPSADNSPDMVRLAALFDSTMIEANQTYAAGCMSWMTPSETTWFSYDAPFAIAHDDNAKRWFSVCTDIARQVLASTNFYESIHESYLEDGAFGTCGMLIEEDERFGVRFEPLRIGEYCVMENAFGLVDTVFREMKFSERQAVEKFGENKVHPETARLVNENAKECDQERVYLHIVMPRTDAERVPGKVDSGNMPWASIYIDVKHKHVCRESGAWEMPIPVHRHMIWWYRGWGFSPGMQALADARQLNAMQQYLDALIEKQVSPPVLLPHHHEGAVDLRAGGVTYFKDEGSIPRFWPNPGNYIVGQDRTEFRKEQINRAFHVELFQALASVPVGKEMTAAEIHMRQRDRLTLFSPTFARKNSELNTPIMRRVFAILMRIGAFPPPPPGLVQMNADGLPYLPDPEITYTSRLALQMKAIHNEAFLRTMEMVGPMFEFVPDVIDNLETDQIFRMIYRNEGASEDGLRPERDVAAMRQARAMQQAAIEAEESAHAEADSVAKLANANLIAAS